MNNVPLGLFYDTTHLNIPFPSDALPPSNSPWESNESLHFLGWDLTQPHSPWQAFHDQQYKALLIRESKSRLPKSSRLNNLGSQSSDTSTFSSSQFTSSQSNLTLKHGLSVLFNKALDQKKFSCSEWVEPISKLSAIEFGKIFESVPFSESQLVNIVSQLTNTIPYAYKVVLLETLGRWLGKSETLPSRQTRSCLKSLSEKDPQLFLHHFLFALLDSDSATQWTLDYLPYLTSTQYIGLFHKLMDLPIQKSTLPFHLYLTRPQCSSFFTSLSSSQWLRWATLLSESSETWKALQHLLHHHWGSGAFQTSDQLQLIGFLKQRHLSSHDPIMKSILSFLGIT